ncbi:Os05g0125200 [Oryza sativa Japonica Group]|uniref:non-specific serine/threonine protein kinase n=3 Tax=Oryza sativa subsp. japonica TaxID=39947 RepID=Q0DL41_ORYSJ|nr:L-type lectin-domain containing receptor kinase VIII.2 [Oryza sativa Japonica Group]AAT39228.1 putative receptor like protein kinase LRK1 [Oryza sativa Japonica Group]BAF16432.1 Os05g0125200 [Oryza sativa Japonica Group]BAS92061.1 Os05g0125200 [Oryza sativa Japonica Group]|eukprot:NP_001054518.1 Os05g0125200 [Oryza sativa Japonica Group]
MPPPMAPPPPPPPPPPILLLLLLLLAAVAADVSTALCFDYATLTLGSLKLLGDAHLKNGTIRLSRDLPVPNSGAGRALYATPVALRGGFSTQFAFTVATLNADSVGGGLAFVLASDGVTLGDAGPYIGVSAASDVAAVEFDTLMDVQFGDVNGNHVGLDLGSMVSAAVADLDGVGVELTSGRTVNAWIEYSPKSGMEVFVSYSPKRPAEPVLSAPLDLGEYVKGDAFVGFSASTQGSTEMHAVEWWTFSTPTSSSSSPSKPSPRMATPSSPPPEAPVSSAAPPPASLNPMLPSPPQLPGVSTTTPSPPASTVSMPPTNSVAVASAPANSTAGISNAGSPHPPAHAAVAGAATAGAFVAVSFAGFALWALARRARARRRGTTALAAVADKRDSLASAAALARSPREFTYKELSAATRGFDASRVIGNGAFGTVYKGIIPDTGAMVAVKRCTNASADGAQARSEFLSELSIIAGLRHRNLLRLQGWCHEKGEILLVYDYMRNGSLDKALFDASSPVLPWSHRREILAGVASALAYLHHECERRVIHRDVKSSNVMLDDAYRARLGDFGLARQAEHGESPDATAAAGTMGYLAPEYLLTGRATEATDVFSFGALVLEVACGRRPIGATEGRCNNLVEWVWSLHGAGQVLDAVDARLRGEYDEAEMRRAMLVGLACSSPEPALRPGMRAVVQMLGGEADPPFVPAARPSMSFSANHQLLLSLQDSVSDYNALGLNDLSDDSSSDSLSSSSLTSTLRKGGHDIAAFSSAAAGDAAR